jgi:hypothetical protein
MGNIFENIGQIHIAVVKDKEMRKGELAQALGTLAVEAIMGGIGSAAWVKYMSVFAENEAQLKVLTAAAEGEEAYLPKSRAYIVSNAVCAAGTNTATTNGVDRNISFAVDDNTPDGTVTKPHVITELLETLD